MTRVLRMLALLSFAASSFFSLTANATNYSLWINGRGLDQSVPNYANFDYWGPSTAAAGVNKKAVNWNSKSGNIASENYKVQDALDCFCTGDNWCYVATHSAGDLMMGYVMDKFGRSSRNVKTAAPNAAGQCGNKDGTAQTGWNIKWVMVASGAGGGSELADAGQGLYPNEPLVKDLKTATARSMYNHNNTASVMFYMFTASSGTLWSALLPGQDDEVVAYHSAGGVSGAAGGAYCNPYNPFCPELTMGTAATWNGVAKWSNRYVFFRDDNHLYKHYQNADSASPNSWANIVGVVRESMAYNAK